MPHVYALKTEDVPCLYPLKTANVPCVYPLKKTDVPCLYSLKTADVPCVYRLKKTDTRLAMITGDGKPGPDITAEQVLNIVFNDSLAFQKSE